MASKREKALSFFDLIQAQARWHRAGNVAAMICDSTPLDRSDPVVCALGVYTDLLDARNLEQDRYHDLSGEWLPRYI
jgi:hypothetical protein